MTIRDTTGRRAVMAATAAAAMVAIVAPAATRAQDKPMPPVVDAITPASGPAGEAYPIQITITGRGFRPRGNTVTFGPARIDDVPSPDGRVLVVGLPKILPGGGGAPPRVLQAGSYDISVSNDAGTSAAVGFTLTDR